MNDESKCGQATPHGTLLEQIMDPNLAKNEREWAAAREIERLRAALSDSVACPCVEDDGDIALDWSAGDMMLSMSVAPTGRLAYAWRTPENVEPHGSGTVHTHPALHEILKAVAIHNSDESV